MSSGRFIKLTNQGEVQFYEDLINGTNRIRIKAPASLPNDLTWTLPPNDAVGFLSNNGAGILTWTTGTSTLDSAYRSGRTITVDLGFVKLTNATGGELLRLEGSSSGDTYEDIFAGADHTRIGQRFNASGFAGTVTARGLALMTNNIDRVTIDSAGALTIGGPVAITQATAAPVLDLTQNGANTGLSLAQTTNNAGLLVTKSGTGSGHCLSLTNQGTGNGISLTQNGNGVGLGIIQAGVSRAMEVTQNGADTAVKLTQTTANILLDLIQNGVATGLRITGGSPGVLIAPSGGSRGLDVTHSGDTFQTVLFTSTSGASDCLTVVHNGTGKHINTNAGGGTPAFLSNAGTWTNASCFRKLKNNFEDVDAVRFLKNVLKMKIQRYRHRRGKQKDKDFGPFQDDLVSRFGLSPEGVRPHEIAAIALVAIKGLVRRLREEGVMV